MVCPMRRHSARIEDWRGAGVFAGGPVTSLAGLFVSAAFARVTYLERDLPDLTRRSAQLVCPSVSPGPLSKPVAALAAFERATYPFDARRQFADRSDRAVAVRSRTRHVGSVTTRGTAHGRGWGRSVGRGDRTCRRVRQGARLIACLRASSPHQRRTSRTHSSTDAPSGAPR